MSLVISTKRADAPIRILRISPHFKKCGDPKKYLLTKKNFQNLQNNILQDAFGKTKLDVVTLKGLSPYIGKTILSEMEYV